MKNVHAQRREQIRSARKMPSIGLSGWAINDPQDGPDAATLERAVDIGTADALADKEHVSQVMENIAMRPDPADIAWQALQTLLRLKRGECTHADWQKWAAIHWEQYFECVEDDIHAEIEKELKR